MTSDKEKEYTARTTMKLMIEKYAKKNSLSYEDSLLEFCSTPVYNLLFDFSSGLWTQGPDYLLCTFEKFKSKNKQL
ncbi:MAG: hypothetical protein WCQ67_09070 [Treponema sp.]